MFTKKDYETLTASQRRRTVSRTALVYITTIVATAVVTDVVLNKVESKFDSQN